MTELYGDDHLTQAQRDVTQAATAAFIVAGFSFLLIFYAILSGGGGTLDLLRDPINLLDPILLCGLALGVLRFYRGAAVALAAYYIVTKVSFALETERYIGFILGLIFLYFFCKGIFGTFSYHRLRKREDPNYRTGPKWAYLLGIPAGALTFLLVAFGLLIQSGLQPSASVVTGAQVARSDRNWLIEEGIVTAHEEVQMFYSSGLLSIRGHGNILTDQRVIVYEEWKGKLHHLGVSFSAIESVETVQRGDKTKDTRALVKTRRGDKFMLQLSPEEGGDELFLNVLRQRIPSM